MKLYGQKLVANGQRIIAQIVLGRWPGGYRSFFNVVCIVLIIEMVEIK